MRIAGVVADANVLLSAAIGKAALRVFTDFALTVHAAQFNADEVHEYLPALGAKYGLAAEILELQWKLLPIELHASEVYAARFASAAADLRDRDPEDAHALALARHLSLPLWTNDRHLRGLGIACYSTAQLLAALGRDRREEERTER